MHHNSPAGLLFESVSIPILPVWSWFVEIPSAILFYVKLGSGSSRGEYSWHRRLRCQALRFPIPVGFTHTRENDSMVRLENSILRYYGTRLSHDDAAPKGIDVSFE